MRRRSRAENARDVEPRDVIELQTLMAIQHSPEHLTGQADECSRRVVFLRTTDLADILTLRLEWIGSDVARRRIAIAPVAGRDVIRLLAPGGRKDARESTWGRGDGERDR